MSQPAPICPGCRYPDLRHRPDCALATMEDLRYYIDAAKRNEDHHYKHAQWQIAAAHRWEGKFRIVKHENNQLRKKLPKQSPDLHQTTP